MIAFFVLFALIAAFIVACVYISMYLHARNMLEHQPEHQFVMLNQEASIGRRSHKQQSARLDVGMGECARRVAGISLAVVVVVVVLVIAFISIVF